MRVRAAYPEPFTESGFVDFNRTYVQTLERFGLVRNGVNPVARTNVCPRPSRPAVPSIYVFAYTVPSTSTARDTFVVSGGAEAAEGGGDYHDSIVAFGDVSIDGLRRKLRYVRDEQPAGPMPGHAAADAADVRLYSLHYVGPLIQTELHHHLHRSARSGAGSTRVRPCRTANTKWTREPCCATTSFPELHRGARVPCD